MPCSTGNNSATAGADYIADASRTLTFAGTKGETQTFSVTIMDDDSCTKTAARP